MTETVELLPIAAYTIDPAMEKAAERESPKEIVDTTVSVAGSITVTEASLYDT